MGNNTLLERVCWVPKGSVSVLCNKGEAQPDAVEEAVFVSVGHLDPGTFKLDAMCGWQASFDSPLAKQKASAHVRTDMDPAINQYSLDIKRGIQAIENSKKTQGATRGNMLLQEGNLRIRHEMFIVSNALRLLRLG